ncbi:serine hydrolase domain-containing protein [Actinoplanes teichomyceticus]|uniref:D-alanyl-D-alanine carboxypeptidase n=1 Tax=Actinoplanes teichomyceticus TaxID=1867 RepID=A0A561VMA8_ACTTI|nr:serine hydrolase domain-containing protein [Actinoplanes teichomyceticus]TWG12759.1 D-alanyl-D-alanine carboxypeptidase [Actinoplanes teichomyceticus]GIF13492.1 serine hydrolase [Actinoplanes teichomyceticus]
MRIRRITAVLALTALSLVVAAPATAATPARATPAGHGDLRRDLGAIVDAGATAALAEVADRSGTRRAAAGVAQLGRPAPAPTGGRFRIGSVSKTFLATVILQLEAERRLRLDDTVQRWLPGVVPGGDRITLRQLLNHTSGLYDYTDALDLSPQGWLAQRFRSWEPAELVALATAQPPLFAPGTDWSYSNTNYVLLGMVVETVTGNDHAAEIQRRIIGPLGLRQTESPGEKASITGPHAHGYLPVGPQGAQKPVDVTRMNPSVADAAGDMISSTADLNTFFAALLGGRLLPPAQLAAMTTMVPGHDYGLGLERTPLSCGVTLYGHGGGIFGYATGSFHTRDGSRRLSLSINPYQGDFDPALETLIDRVFCPAG